MSCFPRRAFAWLLLAGCRGPDAAAVDPMPVVERPTVLLARCELDPAGACVLGPGRASLRLWIDQHEHATVRVLVDGEETPVLGVGVDGGLRIELEVDEPVRSVVVEGVDPRWREGFVLPIVREPAASLPPRPGGAEGRESPADERERLAAGLDELPAVARLAALERLQALAFEQGDLPTAARYAGAVVSLAQRLDRPRAAARAANSAVFIHAYRLGDLPAAQPHVRVLDELQARLPEAAVWAAFSRGLVARTLGDTTEALESFRDAARWAERLGMHGELLTAREGLGITYGELARGSDAVALAQRMLEDAEAPGLACGLRYSAINTAGWVMLLLQHRGVEHLPPEALFERALALVDEGGECPSDDAEVNVRINLALSALGEPDPAMALAWLEPVDHVPERYVPWVEEVEARAGLALGRWDLVPVPWLSPDPRLPRAERWNALMRQAAILRTLGMRAATIDAYADAEVLVEESISAIGVDLGRELFLSGLQASATGLVRELVEAGRTDEALCHARLARGRALRRLDRAARLAGASSAARAAWARDVAAVAELRRRIDAEADEDWRRSSAEQDRRRARRGEQHESARRQLDAAYERLGALATPSGCDALPGLGDGERMVVLFPRDPGWLVLATDGVTATAHPVSELPVDGDHGPWARQVLAELEPRLAGARRLRLLPTGVTWDVPFHALPWRDGVLLDDVAVSYALDLVQPATSSVRPGRALVVADPKLDLPLSRREAEHVAASLERSAWTVERLIGHDATRERLEAALRDATLMHFAGHGEHSGETGWSARLLLRDGEGLGVTDVLALPRVPAAVVLSGCETGRTTRNTLDGGMSIGRAFVLAGSEWVVAVDRRVSDALSFAVGRGLHEELPSADWDGPLALTRIQRRIAAEHPTWDWAAYRVVVR